MDRVTVEPIVVLGTPRSGTSLVSGLLHAHGVWVGTCRPADDINPRGFFENIALRELRLKRRLTRDAVSRVLVREGYGGGPWLVKHTPGYARAWRRFNPMWVLVRRNPDSALASRLACGVYDETVEEARGVIASDNRKMDVLQRRGGIEIWPDDLLSGEWGAFETFLDRIGLSFDGDAAASFLDPALWHH